MKKLFLLDGMALVYRAHFALIARPIFSSKGVNTSALYGFTQTLLEILKNQQPTHIAVAFDTDAPTPRHAQFAEYKATRQVMPEDISSALPHVVRMMEAFKIPVITCDGYEADDIIGTLVQRAEKEGFESYMVTPDKDFGQLVTAHTFLYKPSRMGEGVEIMGVPEIQKRWSIERPAQVVDVLALMGDSIDNVPGVPGIGEKTAVKLIKQFGSVENLLAHTAELSGRVKQSLEQNREAAVVSKKLVTLICDAPCPIELESLKVQAPDEEKLKGLLAEFEFNSIGRRLFGEEFKAGHGGPKSKVQSPKSATQEELVLVGETQTAGAGEKTEPVARLKTLGEVRHDYKLIASQPQRRELVQALSKQKVFSLRTMLVLVEAEFQHRLLGSTLDDAAGECFDKAGKLMGLGYPAGPQIDRLAEQGNPKAFDFPRPMLNDAHDDFSFSGLKTSVRYFLRDNPGLVNDQKTLCDLCASVQAAIVEVLITKTVRAALRFGVRCITASGGVACNRALRRGLAAACQKNHLALRIAEPRFCTDNAAIIGVLAERKLALGTKETSMDADIQPDWTLPASGQG